MTLSHLELLGSALKASRTPIKRLTFRAIDAQSIKDSECLQHLFGSLTTLYFNTSDCSLMLHDSRQTAGGSTLTSLIKSAAPTLETLGFRSQDVRHPQLPEIGEHYLEKLFGELGTDHDISTRPMMFPCLKKLRLGSIILNTPSLMAFLTRQPALESTYFEYVYLATIGLKWGDVAGALPPSCTLLYISECGNELYKPDSPVAYNHIKPFYPYEDDFPACSGWRANISWFEKVMDTTVQRNVEMMGGIRVHANMYNGKDREQWMANMKVRFRQAFFERKEALPVTILPAKNG
jgi:hypothetical protein